MRDTHNFKADKVLDDLVRIDVNRGADFLFLHTLMERLSALPAG